MKTKKTAGLVSALFDEIIFKYDINCIPLRTLKWTKYIKFCPEVTYCVLSHGLLMLVHENFE